ncbi:hypothetical protein PVAP13_5NG487286 [Panicum virgatum]|uniref:Uncharacterized protein n=1 Tax=Panicum virgatum TaxID=38727 RepID=A0A8T0S4N4_PANVG|nr:hypothetical protein PVAP13_5NG487286 [Panicum virgatum]
MGTRPGSRSTRTPWRMATLGARNAAEQDLEFGSCPSKLPLTLSTIQAPPAAYRENHAECRHSHGQHQWSTMLR